jgi:hypothetical protein
LAYSDLSNKAVAHLFETPYIEIVASELNSAILGKMIIYVFNRHTIACLLQLSIVSLDKYPKSSLERIYRQTSVAIEELVLSGNPKAALLQPERDCLKQLDL